MALCQRETQGRIFLLTLIVNVDSISLHSSPKIPSTPKISNCFALAALAPRQPSSRKNTRAGTGAYQNVQRSLEVFLEPFRNHCSRMLPAGPALGRIVAYLFDDRQKSLDSYSLPGPRLRRLAASGATHLSSSSFIADSGRVAQGAAFYFARTDDAPARRTDSSRAHRAEKLSRSRNFVPVSGILLCLFVRCRDCISRETVSEIVVWGIHAGRTGEADSLFLKERVAAIGWDEMGDLSKLPPDREAFKSEVARVYRDIKPGAVPNYAGQLFRFVHEMHPGHIVLYPSKVDRQVHMGAIDGPYLHVSNEPYPNRRHVKWLKAVPRTQFTQGALYELGSAMSLFQVRNYADEYMTALKGSPVPPPSPEKDETVAAVAEDIEENTRDFVLKTLAQELKGHPLAHFVAHLLNTMGYRTRVAPEGPDGGIDIVAHKDELGFEPPIIKVQVKSTDKGTIGDPVVSALYGKVGSNEFGMIVTLAAFSPQATAFAKSKSNLRLIDGELLVDLILSHYEQFDSSYKGLLPLRRVYIPEPLKSED